MSDTLQEQEDQKAWLECCHGYTHAPWCSEYVEEIMSKNNYQREQFPVGTTVEAIIPIGRGGLGADIPVGTRGNVTSHCDDGRAWVFFDGEGHTFHEIEKYVRVVCTHQNDDKRCPANPTSPPEPVARGGGDEWRTVDMTDTAFDSRPAITIEQGDKLLATAYSSEIAAVILRDHRLAALVPMLMAELKFLRDTAFAFHVNESHKPEAFAACEHHVCLRACETWNKVTREHDQKGGSR